MNTSSMFSMRCSPCYRLYQVILSEAIETTETLKQVILGEAIETTGDRICTRYGLLGTGGMGMSILHPLLPVDRDCSQAMKQIMRGKEDERKSDMPEALVANTQLCLVPQYL
jgi:hypothetical protein